MKSTNHLRGQQGPSSCGRSNYNNSSKHPHWQMIIMSMAVLLLLTVTTVTASFVDSETAEIFGNVDCCVDAMCHECTPKANKDNPKEGCPHPYYMTKGALPECKAAVGWAMDTQVKSFSGAWFEFAGDCDMVLLSVPDFVPDSKLSIHIRTKTRNHLTIIKSAAIQIGKDVLQVASWGNWVYNGIVTAIPPGNHKSGMMELQGFRVYHTVLEKEQHHKKDQFDIVLGKGKYENITIGTFRDRVNVKISGGSKTHFDSSRGLMGNWQGAKVGRDGFKLLFDDPAVLAQEWQVRTKEPKLFLTAVAPQYPATCRLKNINSQSLHDMHKDKDKMKKDPSQNFRENQMDDDWSQHLAQEKAELQQESY